MKKFLIEGSGRHIPVGVVDAVCVRVVKVELRDGLAKNDALQAEDLRHHLFLAGGRVLAAADHFPQLPGVLTDQEQEFIHEIGRMGGLVGLGHDAGRNGAVLADQVGSHIPVAAVVEALQNVFRHAVIERPCRLPDGHLQHVVGFLEFVEEGQVVSGELKFAEAGLLDHFLPQDVHRGKEPAAAALLLGCDPVGLHLHFKRAVEFCCAYGDKSKIIDISPGHGGGQGLCVPVLSVKRVKTADLFVCDHNHFSSFFFK